MEQEQAGKIFEFLMGQRNVTADLRNQMNKDLGEKRIDNLNQKREFFKHLTLLIGIILGLSTVVRPELLNSTYFLVGIALNVLVILLVNLYIRETLDRDGEELQFLQDKYNEVTDESISLLEKYINQYPDLDNDKLKKYDQESRNLKGVNILLEEHEGLSKERKNRSNQFMDFSGELCSFLFFLGTCFIVLSIIGRTLSYCGLGVLIICVFYVTFSDGFFRIIYPVNRVALFLKKNKILLSRPKLPNT